MRIIYIIKVLILLGCLPSFGQKNWEKKFNGFVVTNENVLVKGYLTMDVGTVQQGTKIKLLTKPNDTPQIFYALELYGYAYKKDTFRIIRNLQPFPDEKKFIERAEGKIISNGKLILYEIPLYEESYGLPGITTPTGTVTTPGIKPLSYKTSYKIYVIRSAKTEMIGVKEENFQSVMHEVLVDAPDILANVDSKSLKFNHLEKIIKQYNKRFR